jgi:hypothetical protein
MFSRYFQAYLNYFKSEFDSKSVATLLEEYIFEPRANFAGNEKRPEMINRFLEGLLHPQIHIGFGVEFGLPGIVAEGNILLLLPLYEFNLTPSSYLGLAQTAVQDTGLSQVIPPSWFNEPESGLVSRFSSAVGFTDKSPTPDIHAFTILARVLADPALTPLQSSEFEFYKETVVNHGDDIVKYVNQWTLDGDLDKKVEELLWLNVLIYAVGGSEEKGTFNPDFFL